MGLLARNFFGFLTLSRPWQLFLARFTGNCRIFQGRGKEPQQILRLLGKKTKNIQDLGKRNKKVLHQSNTRSINILSAILLENSKRGYSCVCFYLNLNLADQKKLKQKQKESQNETYWNENNGPKVRL